jgi:hypothetical protein
VRPRPFTNSRSVEEAVDVATAGLVCTVRQFSRNSDQCLVVSFVDPLFKTQKQPVFTRL